MGLRTDLTTRLIRSTFDKRFQAARMTRLPLAGKAIKFALFDKDEIVYLPRDGSVRRKTIDLNKDIGSVNIVLPSQVIDHFLERSRYIFIMNSCMCRDASHCHNYPHELGCIFLGKGVTRIPENMGRRASSEEAKEHMRRARDAGLVHLIGRNKIDSLWLNTGPSEDLLSICNCCQCCCLWKMLPDVDDSISSGVSRLPGVEVTVKEDICTGCGSCVKSNICFVQAIKIVGGKAFIEASACRGCGRCVEFCPSQAVELSMNDPECYMHTIQSMEPLVDVMKE